RFPQNLDGVVADHHLQDQSRLPHPQKGDGIEDERVVSFSDTRRTDRPHPEMPARSLDLQLRQNVGVRELADEKGGQRSEYDARRLAEYRLIRLLVGPAWRRRQTDDDP